MMRNNGRILRPLLDLDRQDVLNYLKKSNIPYRTDSTNDDISFLRNRVRHKLIPILDAQFPSWRSSVLVLAETQGLIADFMESEARKRLPWENLPGEAFLKLREEDFLNAPPILREEAVFAAVDMLHGSGKPMRSPRRSAVRRAVRQGQTADLGPARLDRQNGLITLAPGRPRNQAGEKWHGFSLLIKEAGFYTLNGEVFGAGKNLTMCIKAGCPQAPPGKGFSAQLPLVFRNHKAGDFIYKGGRKRHFTDIFDSSERSKFAGILTVCDARGPVAFIAYDTIGNDVTVVSRDEAQDGICRCSFFELLLKHEGINV
jgi:tRNA(Ile)-lysidine synthase